jgi:hypothetical protein
MGAELLIQVQYPPLRVTGSISYNLRQFRFGPRTTQCKPIAGTVAMRKAQPFGSVNLDDEGSGSTVASLTASTSQSK